MQLCGMMVYGTYRKLPDLKEKFSQKIYIFIVTRKKGGERMAS
jgi:hypothetical protein